MAQTSYELLPEGTAQRLFIRGVLCGLVIGMLVVAGLAWVPGVYQLGCFGLASGLLFATVLKWDALRFQRRWTVDEGEE